MARSLVLGKEIIAYTSDAVVLFVENVSAEIAIVKAFRQYFRA